MKSLVIEAYVDVTCANGEVNARHRLRFFQLNEDGNGGSNTERGHLPFRKSGKHFHLALQTWCSGWLVVRAAVRYMKHIGIPWLLANLCSPHTFCPIVLVLTSYVFVASALSLTSTGARIRAPYTFESGHGSVANNARRDYERRWCIRVGDESLRNWMLSRCDRIGVAIRLRACLALPSVRSQQFFHSELIHSNYSFNDLLVMFWRDFCVFSVSSFAAPRFSSILATPAATNVQVWFICTINYMNGAAAACLPLSIPLERDYSMLQHPRQFLQRIQCN